MLVGASKLEHTGIMSILDTSKTEWDLSPLLKSDDDPKIQEYRQIITKATDDFVAKWKQRIDYLEKPEILKEALDELESLENTEANNKEVYYYNLRTAVESDNPDIRAKENQAIEFEKTIINKFQFFWLNLAKIDKKLQPQFLNAKSLQQYKHILERTFAAAKYRLSEAEERLILLKSSVAYGNWVEMTSIFLAKEEREAISEGGKKVKLTEEQLGTLLNSRKKNVRDKAAEAFNGLLSDYADVAEHEINSILANKKIDDELRGYERPDKSRHISDDIESDVVDVLISAVSGRNSIPHRHYKLKTELLGLSKLEYHERGVPYGSAEKEYSYEETCQLIHSVFSELDSEFAAIFERFLKNGQIDVYPRKGKRGGAFCTGSGAGLKNPTYIMLNHTNKIRDVITLAHELGHGINNELIRQKQLNINASTPMSTAEVASTFMEDFVLERLLKHANTELELELRVSKMDDIVATIFRQVGCYKFEQELHRQYRIKGYLSKEEIGKIFQTEMAAYMGPAVEQSSGSQNWWVYWPHIRYFFYVYSYAGGLLISKALQSKVRRDKIFIEKVKVFLAAGRSKSPKDIFAEMGIDITDKAFWDAGLDEIENLMNETEALAKKLGKIKA